MAGIWRKTLVYLGLAEEDDYAEDYHYEDGYEQRPEPRSRGGRRHAAQPEQAPGSVGVRTATRPPGGPRFHLVHPNSFNDAQEVGDKFREGYSVLMNLQGTDGPLARRLVDFASGLAYGLGGSMQPVAESVFLITPHGVQVSAEERRRFLEERGFFNQA